MDKTFIKMYRKSIVDVPMDILKEAILAANKIGLTDNKKSCYVIGYVMARDTRVTNYLNK